MKSNWISVEDRLPEIQFMRSRFVLPLYVQLEDGNITIADYSKSKFENGLEWTGIYYKPIWICRERGVDMSNREIKPVKWMPPPEPPKK